jgi:acetyltransferase
MVMFGLGGIYVEALRDVSLRVCPISEADAEEMIREVKMHRLLEAIRGEPARDAGALVDALLRLSQLALAHPEIAEMDVNPLVSLPVGAVAVDSRIQLAV